MFVEGESVVTTSCVAAISHGASCSGPLAAHRRLTRGRRDADCGRQDFDQLALVAPRPSDRGRRTPVATAAEMAAATSTASFAWSWRRESGKARSATRNETASPTPASAATPRSSRTLMPAGRRPSPRRQTSQAAPATPTNLPTRTQVTIGRRRVTKRSTSPSSAGYSRPSPGLAYPRSPPVDGTKYASRPGAGGRR